MRRFVLKREDINRGNLILVNSSYPIRRENNNLLPVTESHPLIYMERKAASVLRSIFHDMNCQEEIIPVSGFRSREEQETIYQDSLKENGRIFTRKYVALPNHSEHQTGLAIDLGRKQKVIDFIRPEFPYSGICDIFRKKAPFYGFIQRYGADKEKITGISHEPWHFRYVGYPHSKIITDRNLSLEEYIGFIRRFPYGGNHFQLVHNQRNMEIFHVEVEGDTVVEIPDEGIYEVSGNNVDGCIVTVWRDL